MLHSIETAITETPSTVSARHQPAMHKQHYSMLSFCFNSLSFSCASFQISHLPFGIPKLRY